ncbi:hypothetical protein AMTR_s00096p00103520 [Amborella trichopoda]|uniref:Uncharacterized protein n=1 Tax=Amborella trichopoda TaxID=13333 RepID=W1P415_AMBTC|nr:hypothetical protein AMTR_s00096p00103520 [Amborella trichopoda]
MYLKVIVFCSTYFPLDFFKSVYIVFFEPIPPDAMELSVMFNRAVLLPRMQHPVGRPKKKHRWTEVEGTKICMCKHRGNKEHNRRTCKLLIGSQRTETSSKFVDHS